MNIYVESNYILELAWEQAQHTSCDGILTICESNKARLALPFFSVAEPYDTLVRRAKRRNKITKDISDEVNQLSRSESYKQRTEALRQITAILVSSIEYEREKLNQTLQRILNVAELIPLDQEILTASASFQNPPLSLQPQDAFIFASIIKHLKKKQETSSCFINRNSRDFDDPDILAMLEAYNCKMLFNFEKGLNYIKSQT